MNVTDGILIFPGLSRLITPFYCSPTNSRRPSSKTTIRSPPVGCKEPSWKADAHSAESME